MRQAVLRIPQQTVDRLSHLPGRMEALVLAGWMLDSGFVPNHRFDVLEADPENNAEIVYVQEVPMMTLKLWRPTRR